MRIGIVARDFPPSTGGMQNHAEHVARELSKSDEVVVYTLPGCGLPEAPFEQQPILGEELRHDARRLARERVDVWLCLEASYASIARAFVSPVFVYFHGNDFLGPRLVQQHCWISALRNARFFWRYHHPIHTFLARRQVRRGLPAVTKVFTNSTTCAKLIEQLYSRQAVVIHPGVNDSFFQPKTCSPGQQLRLLTVSRLTSPYSRKNIDGVLLALSLLRDNMEVTYTVIGDGPDRKRLGALAAQLGLEGRVRFPGGVSQTELLRHYREADLFILASKASGCDVEGFGIVYLEASASGTPVICSRAGGSTDAVQDGVNGLTIPDSSAQAIADGIVRFADSRHLYPESQVRAFAQQFRWPRVIKRMRAEMCESG